MTKNHRESPPMYHNLLLVALLVALLTPATARAQSPLPPPPPIEDERFGAVQSYDGPEVATSAGVGWTRVLFWWHQVEREGPGTWNPHFFHDDILARELADGRQMVGLLQGTAFWASEAGTEHAVPDGLYLPYNHPDNLWGRFVFQIASRYAGKINHWIIWNEPDVWDDAHPGKTWHGSLEDYVQLLKVGYQAAKAANPDTIIHLAATTYWWDAAYGREQYLTRLLRAINADPDAAHLDGLFDVASVHVYFKPEQVYEITHFFREELNRHGFQHKPLWINETNSPPSEDPRHPAPGLLLPVSLEEQSYFLVQAWAMGLAAGAERMAFYKTRDEPWLPAGVEPYGLQRKDGSLRPVFWSYRTLVTYLGRYERAELLRLDSLRQVVVERGSLGTTTVLWNNSSEAMEATVSATASHALLVDPYGPVQRLEPVLGRYTLTLPGNRRGEIGGKPYLLVEGPGADILLPRPPQWLIQPHFSGVGAVKPQYKILLY